MARDPRSPAGDPRSARIGVFGGTFDPPHLGHLIVAQEVAEALGLDRVLWVPAARPPHKDERDVSPGTQRMAMVGAAVLGNEAFELDAQEHDRGGTSYTVDTLRFLRRTRPECDLTLILGADQYRALDRWREPDEIRRLARIAVMGRGDDGSEAGSGDEGDAERWVPVSRIDISSTAVRARVGSGRSIRYLVPEGVRRIIEDQGLYRGSA